MSLPLFLVLSLDAQYYVTVSPELLRVKAGMEFVNLGLYDGHEVQR